MTTFDPDTFMQQTIDEPIQDEYILCPEGEYQAVIDEFTAESAFRTNEFEYKKGPNAGLPGEMTTFSCPWVIQDDRVKVALGRDKVVVFEPIILDFDSNGKLDTGVNKNVKLGQLKTAVGQKDAKPWGIHMLQNAGPCMVRVKHKEIELRDKSKKRIAEVDRVVPIR